MTNDTEEGEEENKKKDSSLRSESPLNSPDGEPRAARVYPDGYRQFAEGFAAYVVEQHGAKAPTITPTLIAKSMDAVDKLVRIDGHSFEVVKAAMRWAAQDDFWSSNAMSLAGLRKKGGDGRNKFQKILAAMEREQAKGGAVAAKGAGWTPRNPREAAWAFRQAIARQRIEERRREQEGIGDDEADGNRIPAALDGPALELPVIDVEPGRNHDDGQNLGGGRGRRDQPGPASGVLPAGPEELSFFPDLGGPVRLPRPGRPGAAAQDERGAGIGPRRPAFGER
jgi:hypothetical protein